MKKKVRAAAGICLMCIFLSPAGAYGSRQSAPLSDQSRQCLGCHESVTPAIVSDWENSRMSTITPARASEKKDSEKRVSFKSLPAKLADNAVGCAECHTMDPDRHKDSFLTMPAPGSIQW